MPSLDLFLQDRFAGLVSPDRRDRGRVELVVDSAYRDEGILLSEAFATLPGRRPPVESVSNFLGGYVPEGNHRERMAAKRRIDAGDLFSLLNEFGGSIAGAVTLRREDESVIGALDLPHRRSVSRPELPERLRRNLRRRPAAFDISEPKR